MQTDSVVVKRSVLNITCFLSGVLFILSALHPFPCRAQPYRFDRLWPTLQQPWYFSVPNAMAVDREGHVFIADTDSLAVKKFTGDGHLVTEWPMTHPGSVAIDPDGVLYVAGEGAASVLKYTGNGEWIGGVALPAKGACSGLAAGVDGELFVADDYNHRMYRFSPNGELEADWGGEGDGDGRFDSPRGVAADRNGNVYVSDRYNHRVQKFTGEGAFLDEWGTHGKGDGQFREPAGIAVHDDVVYVVDMLNDRVQRFRPDGTFLSKWGEEGSGDRQFYAPTGIAIDPNGYAYVADRTNDRIQKFTLDGRFLANWESRGGGPGEFDRPRGIAIGGEGRVYVADANNHRVQAFTPDGGWVNAWGEKGVEPGQLDTPYGVAVGGDGQVYVADTLNNRIQVFDAAGDIEGIGGEGTEAGRFNDPAGIATGADGHLYVADWENHRIQKFDRNGQFILEWRDADDVPLHRPLDVAVDDPFVYVADTGRDRIVKFQTDGTFINAWGGEGELSWPSGVVVDGGGDVYVADSKHHRILKFTPDGDFIATFGGFGSLPGQLKEPADVAVGPDGRVFVTDMGNNRIQVFRETGADEGVSKAVIVAGGGPFPGNHLWDATRMCANFAYRVLTYQGFSKETIRYLSEDAAVDLDNNPETVEVSGPPTVEALENVLTAWASDADRLVLYLVDHGGEGIFRLSGQTTLPAPVLDDWLDRLQEAAGCEVVVIYDACESGGFLPQLTPPSGADRIVAGSTSPGESAYFVTLGSVSFSNYFWTAVFRGRSVGEAFTSARNAIWETTGFQHPVLDDTGDGLADEADGDHAATVHIGNGTAYAEDAPVIGAVSPEQNLFGTNSGAIYAERVTDPDGVARVWAIIRPPGYRPGASDNTVQALPSVDLLPAEDRAHRYEIVYDWFDLAGVYEIAVHARDAEGNTSPPHRTRVRVNDPLRRRAVIVAGGPADAARWPAVEKNAGLCHEALRFQGYAADDVYFMSPVSFSDGVDAAPTREGLAHALTEWAGTRTRDLVLYLVGNDAAEGFRLNATETVDAAEVREWLDAMADRIPGSTVVICDIEGGGDFAPELTGSGDPDQDRILVWRPAATAAPESPISFSQYLWGRIANGDDLYSAFVFAKNATRYAGAAALRLDDNGNGVGNEPSDGRSARRFVAGAGIRLAGNAPVIGAAPADRILQGDAAAEIRATDVTTTGDIVRVWAVIEPPDDSPLSAAEPPTIELTPSAEGYAGTWDGFSRYGTYRVTIYAEDAAGNVSPPISMRYDQTVGPDAHEPDDDLDAAGIAVPGTPSSGDLFPGVQPARHNFHREGDADWLTFYAVGEQSYEIRTDNPGARCDTVITLYDQDGQAVIAERNDWRDGIDGQGELLSWRCPADGVYFIRISQGDPSVFGAETGYDLSVYIPVQGIPGLLVGRVVDSAGDGVGSARVRSDLGGASGLSDPSGNFVMVLPSGNHAVTVHAPGFEPHAFPDVVVISENTTRRDVVLASPHRAARADAGPDRVVLEGETIMLDGAGSLNPGNDATFAWTQIDGPPATLSSANSVVTAAILPEAPAEGDALTFRLTLADPNGETAADDVSVRVFDKGVFEEPNGILRFETAAGRELGLRIDGGVLREVVPIPPSEIADTVNRPWNLIYGLIRLKTSGGDGESQATFFFPEPAVSGERRYGCYEYGEEAGWREMAEARLSDDAMRMDVPLGDGTASGDVDADVHVIGFGISYDAEESDGSGGGGGGCFIRSAGMDSMP